MGALRLDSARPFDAKIEIHCAKYFKISVATPRPLKFSFSTNSRKLAEQKDPQPVVEQKMVRDPTLSSVIANVDLLWRSRSRPSEI